MFGSGKTGELVPIHGTDPRLGPWEHTAFVPHPLAGVVPRLSDIAHRRVADARAALAALDSTSRLLPNPQLLRMPSLRREAQSTAALEGTYEPLDAVLTADAEGPQSASMREVLNFVAMANQAFEWIQQGRSLTVGLAAELQRTLVEGTSSEGPHSGMVRDIQVVIGQRSTAGIGELPVKAARFVPPPPGLDLEARLGDLLNWMSEDHRADVDPVVAAAMAHYQFEALHPFHDGNGRMGRLMIVIQLLTMGTLSEPTLTVSPWFESRRTEYYDRLLAVSTDADWDAWVGFFARGLEESAHLTRRQMLALVDVQAGLKDVIRASHLRADTAHKLVDFAIAHPSFTVRQVERDLGISYGRANALVADLEELGVVALLRTGQPRRFYAPEVLRVLLSVEPQ